MPVDEMDEEWLNLCKLAAKECNPKQLSALIGEITRLLAAKQQRLQGTRSSAREETETRDEKGQR
jgi:hypothetical protein